MFIKESVVAFFTSSTKPAYRCASAQTAAKARRTRNKNRLDIKF